MKMGKSLGNTLEPKDLVERFGADAVRYFFLREVECLVDQVEIFCVHLFSGF